MSVVISAKDIVTSFGSKIVHDKISFSIKKGEIYGLLGGSGTGKTTLLREMIMLNKYTSGHMNVLGYELNSINHQEAQQLRQKWGVLFQFSALFSSLTILENITFLLEERTSLDKRLLKQIALSKLDLVGLEPSVANLYPSELSGGMKKKASLARALAYEPELLFLDEPTSGLDPRSARAFDDLIVKLRDLLGFSVIIVTHDEVSMKNILDRFLLIKNKKILFEGTYLDFEKSQPEEFAQFILYKEKHGK